MLTYKASLLANRISGRISALLTIHIVKRCFLSINDTAFEEVISPLVDLKKFAQSKRLCDEQGLRLPDTHWSFVISASVSFDEAPNTRTINFQRISDEGIDFICKKKPFSMCDHNRPVSFLFADGKYKPGHKVIQWRGDGICHKIDLEEIVESVPDYSITQIVASCRASREMLHNSSDRMTIQGSQSKFTEIVKETRADLANSNISLHELNSCIQAWRFVPDEMEKMTGSTEDSMWDHLEFSREEGSATWRKPRQLMPY